MKTCSKKKKTKNQRCFLSIKQESKERETEKGNQKNENSPSKRRERRRLLPKRKKDKRVFKPNGRFLCCLTEIKLC